jgi:hypothetical protein
MSIKGKDGIIRVINRQVKDENQLRFRDYGS